MAGNINQLMAVSIDVVGATNNDYTVTRGLEIVDVFTHGNAGTANTVTVQTNAAGGGAGLTNLLAAAITPVANQLQHGVTFTVATDQNTLVAADVIRGIGGAAGTTAELFLHVIPTTWIAG